MPNLSEDYDAIGFDADHTLVNYNIQEITRLLVLHDLNHLYTQAGWPREILNFDVSSHSWDINACLKYCLFDIDNGLILKLGQDKSILAAYKGRYKLSY